MKSLALLFLMLCAGVAIPQFAECSESDVLVAFRGADGSYTRESTHALRKMIRAANRLGEITIWITFDMAFVGDAALRTPDVIAAENLEKQRLISESIWPIEQVGEGALLPSPEGSENAPGCMVEVTARGLELLAARSEVKHLLFTLPQSALEGDPLS